jgi:hypothetical protein
LRPRDIVIMDNLAADKVHGVRQAIEAAGASLRYLPPYSPDFNPAASPHKNAPTISPPQNTMQHEWKLL